MRNLIFSILLIGAMLLPASPSITLTNPATFAQNGATVESDTLAAASEVHIYRASKSVTINYTIGNTGANGEVLAGQYPKTYSITVSDWSTGTWSDSLGANGTLNGAQLTTLRSDLNTLCNHSEQLAIALNKLSGVQNPC